MAKVGDQLLQPEQGWKRYSDSRKYNAFKILNYNIRNYGIAIASRETNNPSNSSLVEFKVQSTRIRLIGYRSGDRASNSKIIINGTEYTLSGLRGSLLKDCLYFDHFLGEGIHHIILKSGTDGSYANMWVQALDIDEDGRIIHPDEVLDIKDLDIGKRIRCHYTATNNQVGVFSNLGKEVYVDGINDFIPPTSSATPNGCFYFICVDKDHLGRWKLIADRNIQHSISWNALNSAGIASGSGINYSLNDQGATIRLLTGGVSSTDKDNEWDKYIVNSDLNGITEPGDNNVWNWNVSTYSWTSTTPSGSYNDRRVLRGYNNLTRRVNVTSNNATNERGFRPVLLLDSEIQKILLKDNVTGSYYYYYNDWKSLGVPENNDELNTWLSEYGMEKINGQHLLTFKQNIGNKVKFIFKLEK